MTFQKEYLMIINDNDLLRGRYGDFNVCVYIGGATELIEPIF